MLKILVVSEFLKLTHFLPQAVVADSFVPFLTSLVTWQMDGVYRKRDQAIVFDLLPRLVLALASHPPGSMSQHIFSERKSLSLWAGGDSVLLTGMSSVASSEPFSPCFLSLSAPDV